MNFTKRQLEKMSDQIRILSWAQGVGVTLFGGNNWIATIVYWLSLQCFALFLDKRSER